MKELSDGKRVELSGSVGEGDREKAEGQDEGQIPEVEGASVF